MDIHPAGWTESVAVCINARGEVAGYGVTEKGERGFLWSGGAMTEILPPGAASARAAWVNGSGDVAGTAVIDGVSRAFLLKDGSYLDPTPGWAFSTAVFVGEDGTVAGSGEFGAYVARNGVTEILPGFTDILGGNAAGQFIGRKDNAARLYDPRKGYLDLTPPLAAEASPSAINENGLVALTSSSAGVPKGFVYSDGWFIQMTPPGWDTSRATAVNNTASVLGFGDVMGTRESFVREGADYEYIAFPGWATTEAVSMNDAGQVAGSGLTESGERHAFMASPTGTAPPDFRQEATAAGGGGCVMAAGAARRAPSAGSAVDVAVLASPLLALFARRMRTRRSASGALTRR
ncbi:MAG: hypothetical protein ACM3NF_06125 [Gemmatimonadota bacterium]